MSVLGGLRGASRHDARDHHQSPCADLLGTLSIAGAHIAMKVNKLQIPAASAGGPNLNELARTLRDLVARNSMPVVLDARASVPFRFVIGALDACARAKVEDVKFQSPPAPDGGGDDWWWM